MGNTIRNRPSCVGWGGEGNTHCVSSSSERLVCVLCADRSNPFIIIIIIASQRRLVRASFSSTLLYCHSVDFASRLARKQDRKQVRVLYGTLLLFLLWSETEFQMDYDLALRGETEETIPLICQAVSFSLLQRLIYCIINTRQAHHVLRAFRIMQLNGYVWCQSVSYIRHKHKHTKPEEGEEEEEAEVAKIANSCDDANEFR